MKEENKEIEEKKTNKNTLTVIDNRTGKSYEIPLINGKNAIDSSSLKMLKLNDDDKNGILCYDPGYINTACCRSKISFINGEKGILEYRGYPIEELCEKSNFLEVSYLLIFGKLPDTEEYNSHVTRVMRHTFIHQNLTELMKSFRYDAHPMGMVISSIAAMSTFYPDANTSLMGSNIYKNNPKLVQKQIFRLLGKIPTIAACAYRHRIGRPYNNPVNNLSYTENFLYMLDRLSEVNYKPHPVLVKALDILFILHAEHGLNCSTATMRQLTSTGVDPYTAISGAGSALYGPYHGGANEAVVKMLQEIGKIENIDSFLEKVKNKEKKLMGFGHRIYKSFDPRAKILKKVANDVFKLLGVNPLLEIALELEKRALKDEYFIKRSLYPNVDFYSGIIYQAMGFPTDFFPVLFLIPRTVGWLAHWKESIDSPEEIKIYRPRQIYDGEKELDYVELEERGEKQTSKQDERDVLTSSSGKQRRLISFLHMKESGIEVEEDKIEYQIPKTVPSFNTKFNDK